MVSWSSSGARNFGDQDDIELQNDTGGEGRVAHLMYGAAWRRWGFWFKLGCLAQKNASLVFDVLHDVAYVMDV